MTRGIEAQTMMSTPKAAKGGASGCAYQIGRTLMGGREGWRGVCAPPGTDWRRASEA